MRDKKVFWLVRTAAFIALLLVLQVTTASMGNIQLLTGSINNAVLIISAMTCGPLSGMVVAAVSPVAAKFLGIGPLWELIPFIALGNVAIVLLWHGLGNLRIKRVWAYGIAWIAGAVGKTLVLYVGIVKIAVPVILQLTGPQATTISAMFSLPQLFTALIGGAVAMVILPILRKVAGQGSSAA